MNDEDVPDLSAQRLIASGAYCDCYEHPSEKGVCIKIPNNNDKAEKRLKADLAYYRKLHKRQVGLGFIADYLGECDTSLGRGYLYECVRDADMQISKTLDFYLLSPYIDKDLLYSQLRRLGDFLLENSILISDIHTQNVLIQLDSEGVMKPVIVDGIGDRVVITLLNIFPNLVKSKIIRRWNRFSSSKLDGRASLYW